jgi:hypothetical protein
MNQKPDFGNLMPDTFADLGNNSYGAAIDDYQAQMNDYNLRGPNAQFIGSNASYGEGEEGDFQGRNGGVSGFPNGTDEGCASSSDSNPTFGTINWTWCASIDELTNKVIGEIKWSSVGIPSPTCNSGSGANFPFDVSFYTESGDYIGSAGQFSNGIISQAQYPCDGGPFTFDGRTTGESLMVLNQVVPANAYFVGIKNSRIRIKPSPNGPQI